MVSMGNGIPWKVHHGKCLYPDDGLEILQGRLGLSEPQGAEKVGGSEGDEQWRLMRSKMVMEQQEIGMLHVH